jgi:hypothetical protein
MKKTIALAALVSFNTLAADLSVSNTYYCTMDANAQIAKGKAVRIKEERFTLHTNNEFYVTIKQDNYLDQDFPIKGSATSSLKAGLIYLVSNTSKFRMEESQKTGALTFFYHKTWRTGSWDIANTIQQMSTGTCTTS